MTLRGPPSGKNISLESQLMPNMHLAWSWEKLCYSASHQTEQQYRHCPCNLKHLEEDVVLLSQPQLPIVVVEDTLLLCLCQPAGSEQRDVGADTFSVSFLTRSVRTR